MAQLWTLIDYLRENPRTVVGVVIVAALIYWLINRKPKLVREADRRLEEIRRERGDPYNKLRPLE